MAGLDQTALLVGIRKRLNIFLLVVGIVLFVITGKSAIGHLNDTAQTVGVDDKRSQQAVSFVGLLGDITKQLGTDASPVSLLQAATMTTTTLAPTQKAKVQLKEARVVSEPLKKPDSKKINDNGQDYITASKAPLIKSTTKK